MAHSALRNLPPLSKRVIADRVERFITRFPGMSAAAASAAAEALDDAARRASLDNSHAPIDECARVLGLDLAAARHCMHIPARDIVTPFPGAAALLADVKRFGLSQFVVTNTAWHTHDACRRDFDDLGLDVDDVVTSIDAASRKPDAQIFDKALNLAGAPPEAAVYVGNDELRDIRPARERGMRTVRLAIEEPRPAVSAADAVLSSLDAVRECLQWWVAADHGGHDRTLSAGA